MGLKGSRYVPDDDADRRPPALALFQSSSGAGMATESKVPAKTDPRDVLSMGPGWHWNV